MATGCCPKCGGGLSSFGDNLRGTEVRLDAWISYLGFELVDFYDGRQLCLGCEADLLRFWNVAIRVYQSRAGLR